MPDRSKKYLIQEALNLEADFLDDLGEHEEAERVRARVPIEPVQEPTAADFVRWADRSKAVTWSGKLGLKERWENRDNPEYQAMLRKMGEKPNEI